MEIQEFILIDKSKVRRDSNLMSLYLQFFESTFNYKPNCAGCSFGTDWNKLVAYYSKNKEKSVTLQKQKVMNGISIKKIKGVILAYKKDGKTYRSYDNILSQEFIQGYLSNGTEEELAERKKMFNFPKDSTLEEAVNEINKIDEGKVIPNFKNTPEPPKGKRGRKPKNG